MDNNFIVDSHCHLDLLEAKDVNIDEIINNADKDNVKILQTICTKITEFDNINSYTKKYSNVFASIGIHPNNVDEQPKINVEEIIRICNNNSKLIGIGETGLDYYYDYAKKENQIESFIKHINIARKTNLPLIIHSRDADNDMITILQEQMKQGKFRALLHCFSSSKELALKALELEIYISISGIVTFKNAIELQNIVKELPLNRILVETDSPYLAPTPHRGKVNQPAFTKEVVKCIASLRNSTIEEISKITTNNFFNLFSKVKL